MTGEITPETVIKATPSSSGAAALPAGNSGINYRTVVVPDQVTLSNRFAMRGYSAISTESQLAD